MKCLFLRNTEPLKLRFRASKTSLILQSGSSFAIFLCLCVGSFIRGVGGFICGLYFVIICSPSPFGVSGRLCFAIVAFPGYLHLYFLLNSVSFTNMVWPLE